VKSKATSYISSSRSESPSRFFIDDDPLLVFHSFCNKPSQALPTRSFFLPQPALLRTVKQIETSTQTSTPVTIVSYLYPSDHPRRPKSSGNGQARGALMKPAFTSRPSLPSLQHTCANECSDPKEGNSDIACLSNVHNANCLLVQTRKGTVGARLPYDLGIWI